MEYEILTHNSCGLMKPFERININAGTTATTTPITNTRHFNGDFRKAQPSSKPKRNRNSTTITEYLPLNSTVVIFALEKSDVPANSGSPIMPGKRRKKRSVFHVRWNPNERFIVESLENPAINSSKTCTTFTPEVSKTTKLTMNPKLYLASRQNSQMCENKTLVFKERILRTFEKAMMESLNESNFYNVDFKPVFGDSFEEQYYPSTCLVMEAGYEC
ncbi:hypothetical protein DOY81_012438 [Sarcophaga bullata]|nr:hypothetical protein DOY81_012438 [Sarcophaga bullata]